MRPSLAYKKGPTPSKEDPSRRIGYDQGRSHEKVKFVGYNRPGAHITGTTKQGVPCRDQCLHRSRNHGPGPIDVTSYATRGSAIQIRCEEIRCDQINGSAGDFSP